VKIRNSALRSSDPRTLTYEYFNIIAALFLRSLLRSTRRILKSGFYKSRKENQQDEDRVLKSPDLSEGIHRIMFLKAGVSISTILDELERLNARQDMVVDEVPCGKHCPLCGLCRRSDDRPCVAPPQMRSSHALQIPKSCDNALICEEAKLPRENCDTNTTECGRGTKSFGILHAMVHRKCV
jgi:hypothetical protein